MKAADESAKSLGVGLASHQIALDASPWLQVLAHRTLANIAVVTYF